jgi:hypothetical protein
MSIFKGTRVSGKMDMTYSEAHALSREKLIGRVVAAIWKWRDEIGVVLQLYR